MSIAGTPYLGMYVHMHWSYQHPYAARTWTLDDWRGYLTGLKALGYNLVSIWPITDTMPDPLTPSDQAHLRKIGRVVDMLHDEFGMAAMITAGPNCMGNAVAAQYRFEDRPFFKTELRVNPGDPQALARLIDFRRRLLRDYLPRIDGFVTIDSDPGGYIGSTNTEFANVLWAHVDMLADVNPQATLYYWLWMGWERYNRYWQWAQGQDVSGIPEKDDWSPVIAELVKQPDRRWALMSCNDNHHPLIERFGVGDRTLYNPYGTVEMEPSIPLTNCTPAAVAQALTLPAGQHMRHGTMANAQTHVAQVPQTYLYSHFARGGTLGTVDLRGFADGLLPGHASLLAEAWTALAGDDPERQRRAAAATAAAAGPGTFRQGPYSGMLFGEPQRFLEDLGMMLSFRADMQTFARVAGDRSAWRPALAQLHASWSAWQRRTGFDDFFMGPPDDILYKPLKALDRPELAPILADLHDWKKLTGRHGILRRLLDAIGQAAGV
jgi:hypothetical protein